MSKRAAQGGTAPRKPRFQAIQKAKEFLSQDVWDVEPFGLPRARRWVVRMLRMFQLIARGFRHDECVLHASSLTFVSLLSFVPVLAIALSMARAFGDVDGLRDRLKEGIRDWAETGSTKQEVQSSESNVQSQDSKSEISNFKAQSSESVVQSSESEIQSSQSGVQSSGSEAPNPADGSKPLLSLVAEDERAAMMGHQAEEAVGHEMTVERIETMIDNLFERIEKLNFGALGGIGVAFLLWTVISVIGQVESAFNRVWGVVEQRPLYRKFTDYLSVVVVVPLLLTAASTIPATSMISRLASAGGMEAAVSASTRLMRTLGTLALLTLSLTFALRFIPNTKVRLGAAFWGGVVAAIGLALWLKICLTFQIGLAKYNTFFGSFAVVPILLFWVYVSWIILLFGAEFSFAIQNADTYRVEGSSAGASARTRLLVALDLLAAAGRAVRHGDGLLRLADWPGGHRVSVRLVNGVVGSLVRQGLLVETTEGSGVYAARFDPGAFTAADAVRAFLDDGNAPSTVGFRTPSASPFTASLDAGLSSILPSLVADLPGDALLVPPPTP